LNKTAVKRKNSWCSESNNILFKRSRQFNLDPATLATFSKKLGEYNISVKTSRVPFDLTLSIDVIELELETETEDDDNSMDLSLSREHITTVSPTPAIPPRIVFQTNNSNNISSGFITPPASRSIKLFQRRQTQGSDLFLRTNFLSPRKPMQSSSQSTKKDRIVTIDIPVSPLTSSRQDCLLSQEFSYKNL
jgi:hypothetical protein